MAPITPIQSMMPNPTPKTYLDSQRDREQGTYNPEGDNLTFSYYDTFTLAHTTTSNRFFTQGLGTNGKTLADTNLNSSGAIPRGQKFICHAIKAYYSGAAGAEKDGTFIRLFGAMLEQLTLEFVIANKSPSLQICGNEMFQLPIMVGIDPTVTVNQSILTQAKASGVYPLGKNPLVLAELVSFEFRATWQTAYTAALDGDRLKFSLCGELQKAS